MALLMQQVNRDRHMYIKATQHNTRIPRWTGGVMFAGMTLAGVTVDGVMPGVTVAFEMVWYAMKPCRMRGALSYRVQHEVLCKFIKLVNSSSLINMIEDTSVIQKGHLVLPQLC